MTFVDNMDATTVFVSMLLAAFVGIFLGAGLKHYLSLDEEKRREFRIIVILVLAAGSMAGFGQAFVNWVFK